MLNNGWISLHRKTKEHWIWKNPLYFRMWIDILFMANHKDEEILVENQLIVVERGAFITSQAKLAKEHNISRNKARTFIKLLKKSSMIKEETTNKFTKLTVCNYDTYQDRSPSKHHQNTIKTPSNEHQTTIKPPSNHHQTDTNNKINKVNNINKENNIYIVSSEEKNLREKKLFEDVKNLWNWFAENHGLSKVIALSDTRKAHVLQRLKEKEFNLKAILQKAETQPFLLGQNKKGWKVNFDFIFSSKNNYIKILENNYGVHNERRKEHNTLTDRELAELAIETAEQLGELRTSG